MLKRGVVILIIYMFIIGACVDPNNADESSKEDTADKILSNDCENQKEVNPNDIEVTVEKPIIYLYPQKKTQVEVELNYDGELVCTYPLYEDCWNVTAHPDGTIINSNDEREYSYLFWEGINNYEWEITKGFLVEGKNTIQFLQNKLSYLGLKPKEYNEFIIYWLPKMQDNKYNLIYFAEEEYKKMAELKITPEPESTLRIFMVYKALDNWVEIAEQELKPFERKGFTVVEWGGTEIN